MKATQEERLTLTVDEVAEILRIGRNSAYEAVKRGAIPSVRLGGRILIPKERFYQMLEGGSLGDLR